jgi:4,4'-diaponeurosporenoate glycosyltransferase
MRMFPEGFRQMSESWGKGFTQGAEDSGGIVIVIAIAWISALCSTAMLLLVPHDYGRVGLAIDYLLFAAQIAWLVRRLGNYHLLTCLLYPLPLSYFCVIFGCAAWRRALGRKAMWRGREV